MTIAHNPDDIAPPHGGYNHGLEVTRTGRLLFISGQVSELLDGTVPASFEEQCEVVWQNIEKVLRSAQMAVINLVKINTFLTDAKQVTLNGEIRRRHLGTIHPASTVVIAQTLDSRWLLEIEAIAARED